MTGFRHVLVALLGSGLAGLLAQPADAAVRHVDCFVLAVGVGGLFGGSPQMFATVTNNSSATIAGNTTYSLTVEGRHLTYHSDAPLAPGQNFHLNIGFTNHSGPCDATYPVSRITVDTGRLKNGTLQMQVSP